MSSLFPDAEAESPVMIILGIPRYDSAVWNNSPSITSHISTLNKQRIIRGICTTDSVASILYDAGFIGCQDGNFIGTQGVGMKKVQAIIIMS